MILATYLQSCLRRLLRAPLPKLWSAAPPLVGNGLAVNPHATDLGSWPSGNSLRASNYSSPRLGISRPYGVVVNRPFLIAIFLLVAFLGVTRSLETKGFGETTLRAPTSFVYSFSSPAESSIFAGSFLAQPILEETSEISAVRPEGLIYPSLGSLVAVPEAVLSQPILAARKAETEPVLALVRIISRSLLRSYANPPAFP